MSSKKLQYEAFYKQLNSFLDKFAQSMEKVKSIKITVKDGDNIIDIDDEITVKDGDNIIDIDDEIINVRKVQDKANIAKNIDTESIPKAFYENFVCKYAHMVVLRNEKYFLKTGDYATIVACHFDEETKKNMWDHLNLLCFLSEIVIGGDAFANARKNPTMDNLLSDDDNDDSNDNSNDNNNSNDDNSHDNSHDNSNNNWFEVIEEQTSIYGGSINVINSSKEAISNKEEDEVFNNLMKRH